MDSAFYSIGRHDLFVVFCWYFFFSFATYLPSTHATRNMPYRAAVYEHVVVSAPPYIVSRAEAVNNMMKNVRIYEMQTKIAASKGAKIIVFPENGLVGVFLNRHTVAPYLEEAPDPQVVSWNPSEAIGRYNGSEIQHELSRIARENNIYMVVNIGTKVPCASTGVYLCPAGDQHQYNTNVVYSDNGTLVAIYHKLGRYIDSALEQANEPEYATFDTPFGRFATVIGSDIILYRPTYILLKDYKIRNLVLPSAWVKVTPFFRSFMIYSGFSRANSVNLLVAGLHCPERRSYGSGLFTPKGARAYFYQTLKKEGQLLIADMDAISEDTPLSLSTSLPKMDPTTITHDEHFYGSVFGLHILFVRLKQNQGLVGICNGDFCCSLDYETHELKETYALGVGNGFIHGNRGRFYTQICSLNKCEQVDNCFVMVTWTKTIFQRLTLSGHNFQTKHIAANVVAMNGSSFLFIDDEWTYNYTGQIYVERPLSLPLHSAVLNGRVYSKDTYVFNSNDTNNHQLHKNNATQIRMKHHSYVFLAIAILMCVENAEK